jgi:methyl-accepting chemotaxis protein
MSDFEPGLTGKPWLLAVLSGGVGLVAWALARAIVDNVDFAAVVGIAVSAAVAWFFLSQPAEAALFLAGVAERMRLDDKVRAPGLPGIHGTIARHLNALAERGYQSEDVQLTIRTRAAEQTATSNALSPQRQHAVGELHDQAKAQGQSLDDTSAAMAQMAATVRTIATSVESLASSAEESGSSILEMSAINDEMSENIGELAAAIEQTSASIEEMIYSIKEVAKNLEDLALAAEQTSTSMNEMEASIKEADQFISQMAK